MRPPIAWVGGKSKLANWITSHFPHNDDGSPDYKMYVEPFGGSAAVLLSMDSHVEHGVREVYNDVNSDLVNFFHVAAATPLELIQRLELVPYSREIFKDWRRIMLSDERRELEPLDRAAMWFAAVRMAYSCWLHETNQGWQFARNANTGPWKPTTFQGAIQRILPFAGRIHGVQVEHVPAMDLLGPCAERGGGGYDSKDTLIYVDPPYVDAQYYDRKDNQYYVTDDEGNDPWGLDQDLELSKRLNEVDGRVVLSYYDYPEIEERYPPDKWAYCRKTAHRSSANYRHHGTSKAEELLLLNFETGENPECETCPSRLGRAPEPAQQETLDRTSSPTLSTPSDERQTGLI